MLATGFIHLHSNHSYDGKNSLEELKKVCISKGGNFLAFTEHEEKMDVEAIQKLIQECNALSDESFLALPGLEICCGNAHILVFGILEPVINNEPLSKIKTYKDQGALIVLAHPHRNRFVLAKQIKEILDGIEIWNLQYDGRFVPRMRSIRFWQEYHFENDNYKAYAGLDLHRMVHFGGPTIKCKLSNEIIGREDLLSALRNGNFKIVKGNITIDSIPKLSSNQKIIFSIIGFFSISFISFSKWLGKIFYKAGLKFSNKIKDFIRKNI